MLILVAVLTAVTSGAHVPYIDQSSSSLASTDNDGKTGLLDSLLEGNSKKKGKKQTVRKPKLTPAPRPAPKKNVKKPCVATKKRVPRCRKKIKEFTRKIVRAAHKKIRALRKTRQKTLAKSKKAYHAQINALRQRTKIRLKQSDKKLKQIRSSKEKWRKVWLKRLAAQSASKKSWKAGASSRRRRRTAYGFSFRRRSRTAWNWKAFLRVAKNHWLRRMTKQHPRVMRKLSHEFTGQRRRRTVHKPCKRKTTTVIKKIKGLLARRPAAHTLMQTSGEGRERNNTDSSPHLPHEALRFE